MLVQRILFKHHAIDCARSEYEWRSCAIDRKLCRWLIPQNIAESIVIKTLQMNGAINWWAKSDLWLSRDLLCAVLLSIRFQTSLYARRRLSLNLLSSSFTIETFMVDVEHAKSYRRKRKGMKEQKRKWSLLFGLYGKSRRFAAVKTFPTIPNQFCLSRANCVNPKCFGRARSDKIA